LHDERAYFTRNEAGARQLVAVGARKVRAGTDVPELASWTMVASLLFGLDEFSMQR